MEANRAAASDALERARAQLEKGDFDAARRLGEKSARLFESDSATSLLDHIQRFGPGSPAALAVEQTLNANDHYTVLSVDIGSHDAAIKKAYKARSLSLHPDRNHAVGAEAAFKRLQEAYTVLSDRSARAAYDASPAQAQRRAQPAWKQQQQQQQQQQQHAGGYVPPWQRRQQESAQPRRQQQAQGYHQRQTEYQRQQQHGQRAESAEQRVRSLENQVAADERRLAMLQAEVERLRQVDQQRTAQLREVQEQLSASRRGEATAWHDAQKERERRGVAE